jgi:hypothetical protein
MPNYEQTIANFKLWEVEMAGRALRSQLLHHAAYVYHFCKAYPAAWRETRSCQA